MGGHTHRLGAPVSQSIERADAEAFEARRVGAFGSLHAPLEIPFGSRGVDLGVHLPVVRLLIDNQPLGAGLHQRAVIGGLHGAEFERNAWKLLVQGTDAIPQISVGNELGMLSGHQ